MINDDYYYHDGHYDDGHADNETPIPAGAIRVRDPGEALEAALIEAGRTSTDAIYVFVEHMEHRMGPHHGARVVAKAWTDPAFKQRLLADGTAAMAELGIAGAEGDNVRVVENTDAVHNLVVCTLCSCYPWPLLGVPPIWYKSFAYRSRAVLAAGRHKNSGPNWATTSRSGCGTPAPPSATSCCPPARPVRSR